MDLHHGQVCMTNIEHRELLRAGHDILSCVITIIKNTANKERESTVWQFYRIYAEKFEDGFHYWQWYNSLTGTPSHNRLLILERDGWKIYWP
jgi:hypothetical protein